MFHRSTSKYGTDRDQFLRKVVTNYVPKPIVQPPDTSCGGCPVAQRLRHQLHCAARIHPPYETMIAGWNETMPHKICHDNIHSDHEHHEPRIDESSEALPGSTEACVHEK